MEVFFVIGITEHYNRLEGYVTRIEGAYKLSIRHDYSKIAVAALLELYA